MSNTEQKQKILLKRTTEVDRPSIPSGASHGELFLNIASGANAHNKISTMQIGTNNPIIWSDDVANEKKFALKTEVEALVKEVEDNELVTATAISTMNTSAGFNEDGSSVLEGGVSLSQAIIDLQARAGQDGDGNVITTTYSTKEELSGAVEELSGDVNDIIEEIIDNELVTSTAISTMNASAGFNEDGSSVLEGGVSLSQAIIELQNKTQDQGNYYFYLNELGELASSTISDEEIEKLRNSKNIYVVDNNNGLVFNCDFTVSVFDEIVVFGSVTIWNTNNTVTTMTAQIAISPTENRVTLVTNEFYVASSYLLRVTCDDTTGVIGGNIFISSSEIEKIRKSNIVFVKIELPEGEYTFSCSKKDDNDSIITLVGSQVYGLDGYWTNTSKIVSLTILIDTASNTYSGQIYNIVTGEHSKLADSATTSISATTAVSASTSDKAYKDGSGNVISSTYASKTELENLIQEVEDSEFVTATALNQINTSVGLTEGGISQLPNQQTLTEAIIDLQNKTKDLEESDPIFTDSPAAGITGDDIENWDNKLDKDGKAVSAQTADFATDLSGRVEATPEEFTFRPSAGNKSIRDDSATIKRIKGNSIVWNQVAELRDSGELNGLTFTKENGILRVSGTVTEAFSYDTCILTKYLPQGLKRDGRKYLISINAPDGIAYGINGYYISNTKPHFWSDEADSVFYGYIAIKIPVGTTVDYVFSNPQIIDLTQMFGAGNEPDTVEEFRELYPDSYYPYNTGELRNLDCSGIKTVGFNQWDEQWEVGSINQDGGDTPSTTMFRSVGYMQILQQKYCVKQKEGQVLGFRFYDENKVHISGGNRGVVETITTLIPPLNAAYMRFVCTTSNTYNNDICINLHHTGYRDGEYEPYKEVTHSLPLSQITNGEPLRKAGSVYDEINETEYIKRVGVVDLGSYNWWLSDSDKCLFACNFEYVWQDNSKAANILCAKYVTLDYASVYMESTGIAINFYDGNYYLTICDKSFTDAASLKASLSGVLLHYELAEPIVKPIETPIDFNYYVEDFGTEEALLTEDSAPFRADIVYQFNATDRIRENSLNIEKLSKTQNEYLPLTGGTMSGQVISQDIKPVEDNTYQLGDSTHKYKNVFSDFFTGNLEGNAKTATVATDLSGRVEATPEVFTYRPSAGEKSIKDDNAFIRRVKGNSVVWNQLSQVFPKDTTRSAYGVSAKTVSGTHYIECSGTTTAIEGDNNLYVDSDITPKINGVSGHKYLFLVEGCENLQINLYSFVSPSVHITNGETIVTCTKNELIRYSVSIPTSTPVGTAINEKISVLYIDLTQMFGAGNEPTTVEEFRALYPDSYYPYNAGELRNLDCSGIKTVGFNQWDEQWELGSLGTDEYGSPITFDGMIRSANYNPIFPSTEYYIRTSNAATYIWYYDSDKKYIGRDIKPNSRFFITPTNAAYFKLRIGDTANTITTYNHDICINLHHTGWRDGEYAPYKEVTHTLPLSKITNGEPLRKAGSVYDEINETHYIKRVGVVDLGELEWIKDDRPTSTITWRFKTGIINNANQSGAILNILSSKYTTDISPIGQENVDDTIIIYNGRIYIEDTSYTDVTTFKQALSGVMLNYELAEPIVTPIETPIDFNYYVEDFGTEEALLAEDSAPFRADIVYQFNATDRIRENSLNIEKLSKTQKDYLPLTGGTMSSQVNSQDIKPVEDNTYQLGDSTHKYKNVFSDFFTGNLEGNAKTATVATDLSGRVEATPEVFTYRPSAGEKSIKDDNAFIRRVKGNSVVWNQLVDNNTLFIGEKNGMVISKNEDGSITFNGTASADIFYNLVNLSIPIGHKVALTGVDNMSPFTFFLNGGIGNTLNSSGILTCSHIGTNGNGWMFLYITANTTFNNVTINPKIHYLTQMFGIGNEPNSIEEFRALYPDSYYPYNAGELRNLNCYGIKTVGFNQWDEQWEVGQISSSNGNVVSGENKIISKNYIPVLPNTSYFLTLPLPQDDSHGVYYYDGNKNYIGYLWIAKDVNQKLFTTPSNCLFIKFDSWGTTYNNNICINLHHTGYRDGEYEPYKEVTYALPQIPLRKAGSVYDEINETHFINRVGVVDLGRLSWSQNPDYGFYVSIGELYGMQNATSNNIAANILCTKYITGRAVDIFTQTKTNSIAVSTTHLVVGDLTYNTVNDFKSAMSGVMLNYELAEPIVIPIEAPIDFNYYVEDFGTEEALLTEDSAPFNADIIYQFNAVDRIRQNDININRLDKELLLKSDTWHTHSEYATTTALNDLISDIEDNELIISTIVTKINDSCGFNEDSESVLPNGQNLTEAIIELQRMIQQLQAKNDELENRIKELENK